MQNEGVTTGQDTYCYSQSAECCDWLFTCCKEAVSGQQQLRRDLDFRLTLMFEGREVSLVFIVCHFLSVAVISCKKCTKVIEMSTTLRIITEVRLLYLIPPQKNKYWHHENSNIMNMLICASPKLLSACLSFRKHSWNGLRCRTSRGSKKSVCWKILRCANAVWMYFKKRAVMLSA